MKLREYLLYKEERRLAKREASLQDFRDLKRKGQIPSDSKESMEKIMDRVAKQRDASRVKVRNLRGGD